MIKYKKGIAYPSHEYIKDVFGENFHLFEERGFIVGTHSENISTAYNIPFKGRKLTNEETGNVLRKVGILEAPCLKLGGFWKRIYRRLPHWLRRKIRYYFGEKLMVKIYDYFNRGK